MQAIRQLGVGVIIAVVSVMLVLGGIFLSLAETLPPVSTPTEIPPTLPFSFPTPTETTTPVVQSVTATGTATGTPTETATPSLAVALIQPTAAFCNPPSGWTRITTGSADSVYSLAQRYKTSAESLAAANCLVAYDLQAGSTIYVPPIPTVTVIPCGAPSGWVRAYTVVPGDNLYRIALSYGLTYSQLQRANCMGSSVTIYVGQRLYVPNIPTRTPVPGITLVPNFPTDTPLPTSTSTSTNIPTFTPTDVPPPTATTAPTSISTATVTAFPQ